MSVFNTIKNRILENLNDLKSEFDSLSNNTLQLSDLKTRPHFKFRTPNIDPDTGVSPSTYISYTPNQLLTAYGVSSIIPSDGTLRGNGITIAIIIAYHYPNLQTDLNTYLSRYSLPPVTLNIINLDVISNNDWALEECLDVQMIASIAPGANIIVIEAVSSSLPDLQTAINTAITNKAKVISMSWGSQEFSIQNSYDTIFSNNPDIIFCASSGDTADIVNYPSTSPNVISVGGSSLSLTTSNTRSTESVWSAAGAGFSKYSSKPKYQSNVNSTSNKRSTPDIALTADPNFGVIIYSSINGGYMSVGGTSCACPMFAGMMAITNQLRVIVKKSVLSSVSTSSLCIQNYLYKTIYPNSTSYASNMYDITVGTDGTLIPGKGYDVCSGLGSVNANLLCSTLINI
jgi:subtilase family serine protease